MSNTPKDQVEWMSLNQISTNLDKNRKPITSSKRKTGIYPYYGASGVIDYVDNYLFDGEYLLISEDGANLLSRNTPIAFAISGKSWVNNHAHVLQFSNRCTQRFVELYLNSIDLSAFISVGAQPKLNQENLNRILIPIPPLEEQERIASILDKYSSIKDQLTKQLDREIELTLKQYEYYREELLSFKDSDTKWLPMGEIGEFIRGNGLQKKDFVESGVGCIHYGEIYTHYGTSATETKSFVSEELAVKLRKAKHGDLVIATTSENVEDLCKAVAWLGKEDICIGGHSCLFRHNQNPMFLTYLTQTSLFSSYKRRYGQGVKVVEMSCKKLETFELPIPSLEEQERIVAILDKYSESVDKLVSNLRREKELVQKQYEYYREKLLTF